MSDVRCLVRYSLALGGILVTPDERFSFKLFIYVYMEIYIIIFLMYS